MNSTTELLSNYSGIVTGITALVWNGICSMLPWYTELSSSNSVLNDIHIPLGRYVYKPYVDKENYLRPSSNNPKMLVPTVERAVVEYILDEEHCDEGILIEALKNYLWQYPEKLQELYKVAEFYGLARETLDYWLEEARTDDSILSE